MDQILDVVRSLDGVLMLAPEEGSDFPRIAWGDFFFYYAPDGQVPGNVQPYATIVTKDYPDEPSSGLDPAGRWRVNIHVGAAELGALTGDADSGPADPTVADVVVPHPVYARLGWVAVVNPAEQTMPTVLRLLRTAHADQRRRLERRQAP